jgi:predicted TIM-barrel fold metal-dependent hydrolase
VFIHPSQNSLNSPFIRDWGLGVCCGASMEDSLAALHLIKREIPHRYPHVRFIVPHFGGILPMLLNRLDGQMPQQGFIERPSVTARRFFYDTVGWGSKAALIAALEAFGPAQLVPGSDFPILLPWESYAQTFRHIEQAGLDPAISDQILHSNAQRLLGL